jgi:hypothetical protein
LQRDAILLRMTADLSRYADWLDFLTALPHQVPALQVVVVNGSAVTGGWDEHSDLDVEAWCSGPAQTTYDAVLALARERFGLLRIQHCPARHDFGLRYLRTDLPAGLAERVETLLPGPDLAVRSRAAFAWQDELLAQLS